MNKLIQELIKNNKVSRTGTDGNMHFVAIDSLIDITDRLIAAESNVKFRDENIELKSKLAELQKQEPCGFMQQDAGHTVIVNSKHMIGGNIVIDNVTTGMTPVYTQAKPCTDHQKENQIPFEKMTVTMGNDFSAQTQGSQPVERPDSAAVEPSKAIDSLIFTYMDGILDDHKCFELLSMLVHERECNRKFFTKTQRIKNITQWIFDEIEKQMCLPDVCVEGEICCKHKLKDAIEWLKSAAKPQRITEQDARTLIGSFLDSNTAYLNWKNDHLPNLLAKLNEHREPEVKQNEGVGPVAWRRYAGIFCGSPCFSYRENKPLDDVFEWKELFYREPVAANKAEMPLGMVLIDENVIRFLNGEISIKGRSMGDQLRTNKYWWRTLLPKLPPLKDGAQ